MIPMIWVEQPTWMLYARSVSSVPPSRRSVPADLQSVGYKHQDFQSGKREKEQRIV
nr:MAG TPA: hypothetical protein [Caudoviricetes sp.]